MGHVFTITTDIRSLARDCFDDMINELGKPCRLIYPSKMTPCANCIGGSLNSTWITGGPIPFQNGSVCPLCNGTSFKAEEVTRDITLLVETQPAKFVVKAPKSVNIPYGIIQTKGFMSELPYVLQARTIIVQSDIEELRRYQYILMGEPVDQNSIIQGRYFVCLWERSG